MVTSSKGFDTSMAYQVPAEIGMVQFIAGVFLPTKGHEKLFQPLFALSFCILRVAFLILSSAILSQTVSSDSDSECG
jgi:hypothetical protein